MSTAADGLPSRKQAALLWVAHRQLWFTGLMVAIIVATIVNGDYLPFHLTHVGIFFWIFTGTVALFHREGPHGNNCIECLYRQPDDGGQRAEKRMHLLWFNHKPYLRFITSMGLIAIYATISTWSLSLSLAFYAAGFTLIDYTDHIHHKLRPWCPWCKHRGHGGNCACQTTPDPSMTKVN